MFFCREAASVELPLGKYGLGGEKASVELLSFSDSSGSPQVKGPKRGFYPPYWFDSLCC